MSALTREELLDIDPKPYEDSVEARLIALRHAWNCAVYAEKDEDWKRMAAISQAWSAIAEALK